MFQRCKFPVHLKKAGEKGERPYVWVVLQYFFEGLIFKQISHLPTLALCSFTSWGGPSVYKRDYFQIKLNWDILSGTVFNVLRSHMDI